MVSEKTDYWRGIVAAAAEIKTGHVTQFSPDGFGEWLGSSEWAFVVLGPLVLKHNGEWRYLGRRESLKERQEYAHRSVEEALAYLRVAVAPDEPACADMWKHTLDQRQKRSAEKTSHE